MNESPELGGEGKIVLASGSPRRREIFARLGIPHEVASADIDENLSFRLPRELALKVALAKANAVIPRCAEGTIVVSADTIVVLGQQVYGKPAGEADGRRMLGELTGKTHSVITAIAVAVVGMAGKSSVSLESEEAKVTLFPQSDEQIAGYVATGEPLDKAGAYAAQGIGRSLIDKIQGDYWCVVGLPVERLLILLEQAGLDAAEWRSRLPQLSLA